MRRAFAASLAGSVLLLFAGMDAVLGADTSSTAMIGLREGEPAAASCPAATYLAGVTLWFPTISGVSPYCAAMTRDGRWQGGARVHLDVQMSNAVRGDEKQMNLFCPLDFFVSGLSGYSQVYGIHGLTQLTLVCRNLKTGASMTLATPLRAGVAQTQWPQTRCADDSAATGVFGSARDDEVIQLGYTCRMTQPAALQARMLKHPNDLSVASPLGRTPGPVTPGGPAAVPRQQIQHQPQQSHLDAQSHSSSVAAASAMPPVASGDLVGTGCPPRCAPTTVIAPAAQAAAPVRPKTPDQAGIIIVGGKQSAKTVAPSTQESH
jgi:hypothetical protein